MKLRSSKRLMLLCGVVYFASYITRINYAAVLVEIISSEGYGTVAASAAVTGLFIMYGVGQLPSGFLGDRIKPELLIADGLTACALMNCLIPFCRTASAMCVIWCINGLAQAFIWPPLVRIMSGLLSSDDYKKACVTVNAGSAVGTVAVYLSAPLIISISGWRAVFFVCGGIALVIAALWIPLYYKFRFYIRRDGTPSDDGAAPVCTVREKFGFRGLVLLMLIITGVIIGGLIRDGMTTWLPSFVFDTFSLGSGMSILVSAALPLFSIPAIELTYLLNRRLIKNELTCTFVIFCVCSAACLLLYLIPGKNAVLSVVLFTFAVACVHGVNILLTNMVPPYFKRFGGVSAFAGIINASTYIGSSASIYGVAKLTEAGNWNGAFLVWLIAAVAGAAVSVIAAGKFGRLKNSGDNPSVRTPAGDTFTAE